MRFLVVTNAPTLKQNEKFVAYAPYVNEMNMWFKKIEEVGILSPGKYPDSIFTKEFDFQQIKIFKLPFLKFATFINVIHNFLLTPIIFFQFVKAFIWADHIHLRCPGNIGLMGCFVQILFPKTPKTAKYAGNWDPQAKQPWSYRLQKWILSNTFLTRNMQVLVYGEWPGQSQNVISFFTASFSEREIEQVREKKFETLFTFLFVGTLVEGKQPLEAIKMVEVLNAGLKGTTDKKTQARLEFFGDGLQREELEIYIRDKHLEKVVIFKGSRPLEELKFAYQKAHFIILPSRSEGWPKALAEGMFFGCIPIATPVSCVPWMLGNGSRGILAPPAPGGGAVDNWFEKVLLDVQNLINKPKEMKRMSLEAQEWSQQYTLEKFEAAIQEVLEKSEVRNSSYFRGGGMG